MRTAVIMTVRAIVGVALLFCCREAVVRADDWGPSWNQDKTPGDRSRASLATSFKSDGALQIRWAVYGYESQMGVDRDGGYWYDRQNVRVQSVTTTLTEVSGGPGNYRFRETATQTQAADALPGANLSIQKTVASLGSQPTIQPGMTPFDPFVLPQSGDKRSEVSVPKIGNWADATETVHGLLRDGKLRGENIEAAIRCVEPGPLLGLVSSAAASKALKRAELEFRFEMLYFDKDPAKHEETKALAGRLLNDPELAIHGEEEEALFVDRLFTILIASLRAADAAHPTTDCSELLAPLDHDPARAVGDPAVHDGDKKTGATPVGADGSSERRTTPQGRTLR